MAHLGVDGQGRHENGERTGKWVLWEWRMVHIRFFFPVFLSDKLNAEATSLP